MNVDVLDGHPYSRVRVITADGREFNAALQNASASHVELLTDLVLFDGDYFLVEVGKRRLLYAVRELTLTGDFKWMVKAEFQPHLNRDALMESLRQVRTSLLAA